MLRSLDLFAGIGGIAHGLRGFASPAMYCEIDPDCQKVLQKLFAEKRLPRAPIHGDVTTLDGRALRGKVDLIAGGSPCFPAGALVTTERGYVPIEDLVPGDQVWTHEGRMRTVLNTQRKLHAEHLVRLDVSHHPRAIETTDEHPFWVRDRVVVGGTVKYSEPHWVEARDLIAGYHVVGLAVNTESRVPEFEVEVFANATKSRTDSLRLDRPEHWWLMGYFMGDGWLQSDKKKGGAAKYNIYFVIADDDKHDAVRERLSAVLPMRFKEAGRGCTKYRAASKMWWHILDGFGRYAHGKRVPQWVQDAPRELLAQFLEGYMAADGSVRPDAHHEHRTSSVSAAVSLGVQALCAKLGHVASVRVDKKAPTCVIEGRTVNQRCAYHVSFRPDRVRAVCAFVESGYVWYKLRAAAPVAAEPAYVYNCEVEGDNSYHVDNVAVHNCIGWSTAGKGEGFDNAQSNLYAHIVRLISEVQPTYVFLENVAAITEGPGLVGVLKTLGAHGYDAAWMCLCAYNAGSPQKRKRWFCLGTRRGTGARTLASRVKFAGYDWRREPAGVPRMTAVPDPTRKTRMHMLGNTAVPDVVRIAFRCLWQGLAPGSAAAGAGGADRIAWAFPPRPADAAKGKGGGGPGSAAGMTCGACPAKGAPYAVPCPALPPRRDWGLVLDPKVLPRPKVLNPLMTSGMMTAPHRIQDWATPRCMVTGPARVLTNRCKGDLPTQLRFERGTKNRETGAFNPRWIEWLMGYDLGWTAPPAGVVRTTADATTAAAAAAEAKKPAAAKQPAKQLAGGPVGGPPATRLITKAKSRPAAVPPRPRAVRRA
jgi:hypothetical protein